MQITREDLPDRQVALVLEFEPQEIEPALQKTYQRLVQRVNIPGFRPGKAPRAIFERYVGREQLVQEASQSLMADAVKTALEQEKLEGAELNDAEIESTEPLRIRVLFDQEPLVEVGEYADIRVAADEVSVSPDDVEMMLDRMRRREADWHEAAEPRPARYGDRVTVDLETFTIDGPVPEMTGLGQTLELSEKTGPAWPREIDENVIGMQVGEEKDFAMVFPEAYTDEKLRGRDATVHVKLTKLEEADLPELNDEFANRVAQVESVDQLRTRLEESLRDEVGRGARSKQVQEALDQLKSRSNITVSAAMLENEVQHRYERLAADLQQRKIAPARYFSYEGTTEAAWRESQREPAREALKELLVLREFAKREGITVEEADVQAEMDKMLGPYADNPQAEKLRELIDTPQQREQITNRLFERKLTDRLVAIVEGRGDEAAAEPAPATGESVTVQEPGGAVPATEQEPGPFETAGGAAELLGTGTDTAATADENDPSTSV